MPGGIKTSFQGQIDAVNTAIANMQTQVDNFIAGARGEYPFVNLIKREHWRFEKDDSGNFQHPFALWTLDSRFCFTNSFVC